MQVEAPNQVTDKICWDSGHKSPFDCCPFQHHLDWALEQSGSKIHWEFSWLILRHWPRSQSFPSWRSWNQFHWDEHERWSWSRVCWLFWNVFLHFFLGTDVRSALNLASFWYQDLRWQSGEEKVLKIWIKGYFWANKWASLYWSKCLLFCSSFLTAYWDMLNFMKKTMGNTWLHKLFWSCKYRWSFWSWYHFMRWFQIPLVSGIFPITRLRL